MNSLHKTIKGKGWCSFVLNPWAARVTIWDIRNPPHFVHLTDDEIDEVTHFKAYCTVLETKHGETIFGLALPKRYNEWCTWHEAIHCVDEIFEDRGVPISSDNGEVRTYTTEYLVKLIKQNFYNKKVTDLE